MREIKFRAWDKEHGYWQSLKVAQLLLSGDSDSIELTSDRLELCLYTGLKDKNGVEIYEGDILSHRDSHFIVRWDEIMAAFQVERVGDKVDADFFNWGNVPSLETKGVPQHWNSKNTEGNCEVIGNIYENPELLKTEER